MPLRNLLKTTPPEAVRSLDELFAIAQAMEHEAGLRYTQLAARMRSEGNPQLAALFERLAADEQGHEAGVQGWSERESGKSPDRAAIRWDIPETFDEETAAELASSRIVNAYRVLSMAVRNEERAFVLWSYIAAQAEDIEIQRAAERMAHEELGHASLLRRARRAAYHAGRSERPAEGAKSAGELLALAAGLEARLGERLGQLAGTLNEGEAAKARELAAQSAEMAVAAAALASDGEGRPATEDQDLAAIAERLVELYLDIGDYSRREHVVEQAQALARQAIARLAWLRLML